jgi:hypothetical protein
METKTAVAVGTGIIIGKTMGGGAWWLLGACAALLIVSPKAQAYIGSGARKAYASIKR